jgi:hypothetical protein
MTRQRRRRKYSGNSIHDLQEWQDHQYDPGYLSNLGRLRLFSGGRSTTRYLLPILATFLAAILVLPVLEWAGLAAPLILLVGLALLTLLVVTLTQPLRASARRSRHRAGRGR